MEKFYDLIPSETVRKHCIETNYKLTAVDCMLLVKQNRKLSLEEKHMFYNEIMDTMPEEKIPAHLRKKNKRGLSLYEILKEHIQIEKNDLEKFLDGKDRSIYKTVYLNERPLDELLNFNEKDNFFAYYDIDNVEKELCAEFSENHEIKSIQSNTVYNEIFSDCSVKLPVPFKKGDLLVSSQYGDTDDLYVFEEHIKPDKSGVSSYASAYTFNGNTVHRVKISCFTFDITERISPEFNSYKMLSDYLKGKINVDLLLNAHLLNYKKHELESKKEDFEFDCCNITNINKYIKMNFDK